MTAFDWIAGGLLVFSALLGLMRGATRQVASILGFFVAGALALTAGPGLGHGFEGVLRPPWLARVVAMGLIFLIAYFAIVFVGAVVTRGVRGVGLSGFDRLLGLGVGVARGLVVLGALVLALGAVMPKTHMPSWIGKARLWPLASGAGAALEAVAPKGLDLGKNTQSRAQRLQVVEDHN